MEFNKRFTIHSSSTVASAKVDPMKRFLLFTLLILVLALAAIYLFIPKNISISKSLTVDANRYALYRKLADPNSWQQWWPGKTDATGDLSLNGLTFKRVASEVLSFPVTISSNS